MRQRIQSLWVSHLKDSKEREDFTNKLLGSRFLLDKLSEIVYNIVKMESRPSTKDYDSPSWAYLQAHQNGRLEAFEEILKLISISDKEE